MKKKELEQYREQLLEMARRLSGDVADLSHEALRKTGGAASGNLSNVPTHPADLGTDSFQQDVSLSLLENEQQRLEEINAALARLDQGTYGRCESCGKEIAYERLQAVPYAALCIDCARRETPAVPPHLAP